MKTQKANHTSSENNSYQRVNNQTLQREAGQRHTDELFRRLRAVRDSHPYLRSAGIEESRSATPYFPDPTADPEIEGMRVSGKQTRMRADSEAKNNPTRSYTALAIPFFIQLQQARQASEK